MKLTVSLRKGLLQVTSVVKRRTPELYSNQLVLFLRKATRGNNGRPSRMSGFSAPCLSFHSSAMRHVSMCDFLAPRIRTSAHRKELLIRKGAARLPPYQASTDVSMPSRDARPARVVTIFDWQQ
jgi:hypothetical protein